jgi:hypothetical protein
MDAGADGGEEIAPDATHDSAGDAAAIDARALPDAGTDGGGADSGRADSGIATSGGINLSWGDCGTAGAETASWACDSNTGQPAATIVASFSPPPGVTELVGLSAELEIRAEGRPIPDWWRHSNPLAGGPMECRGTMGLSLSFDFSTLGSPSCDDWSFGHGVGGFVYEMFEAEPDRVRIRLQGAIPHDSRMAVSPSTEYYAFRFNVLRNRTVGPGSCSGCDQPMVITLQNIMLFQPVERGLDPILVTPIDGTVIHWQSAP